ncbi:hypothetical protein X777_03505, partial [Ooceraea biroi]
MIILRRKNRTERFSTDHDEDDRRLPAARYDGRHEESQDGPVSDEGREIADVGEALHQRYCAHRPVAAQVTRKKQQSEIHRGEI